MEEERLENTEQEQENLDPQPENVYVPRPAYQVWAARIGLVIVIIAVILYYLHIARGGL